MLNVVDPIDFHSLSSARALLYANGHANTNVEQAKVVQIHKKASQKQTEYNNQLLTKYLPRKLLKLIPKKFLKDKIFWIRSQM